MFVSLETPFRGEAATGILFVRAGFKPLANGANMRCFAEFVKGALIWEGDSPQTPEMDSFEQGEIFRRMFLDAAWGVSEPTIELAKHADITELFFDMSMEYGKRNDHIMHLWQPWAVHDADVWLKGRARMGNFEGEWTLPPPVVAELVRRMQWGLIALMSIEKQGEVFTVPVPLHAPAPIKGFAVFLYVMGGLARDYPSGFFPKEP